MSAHTSTSRRRQTEAAAGECAPGGPFLPGGAIPTMQSRSGMMVWSVLIRCVMTAILCARRLDLLAKRRLLDRIHAARCLIQDLNRWPTGMSARKCQSCRCWDSPGSSDCRVSESSPSGKSPGVRGNRLSEGVEGGAHYAETHKTADDALVSGLSKAKHGEPLHVDVWVPC
jgi:hypothetical protein